VLYLSILRLQIQHIRNIFASFKYLRDRYISTTKEIADLSKRKTGALRKEQNKQMQHYQKNNFFSQESKTIDFNQEHYKRQRKPIELLPQSVNQEKYILSLIDRDLDIVVVSGPAGTGKTYLAMLAAIQALRRGDCDKIILTRPAVAVEDEKHGFLPGDINSKMEPWVRPLLDILREYYSVKEITHMLDEQIIEITPLAFCRGRNFKHSYVILDEAQNATPAQLKMLMTRISTESKIVITGDVEQTDRRTMDNGLLDLTNKIKQHEVPGMVVCEFTTKDIKRHRIIEHILKLYP
jgi:phosphate starvation-inducible PhoH-like protein